MDLEYIDISEAYLPELDFPAQRAWWFFCKIFATQAFKEQKNIGIKLGFKHTPRDHDTTYSAIISKMPLTLVVE